MEVSITIAALLFLGGLLTGLIWGYFGGRG